MPYSLKDKLVVAIASSALFELGEADEVYRRKGLESYRAYQRERESETLKRGVAYPLIRRLLQLNPPAPVDPWVEVILLSRNDPDTGLRVFNSIEQYQLPISRAIFVNGEDPFRYMKAFNACLFLSANPKDVEGAVSKNLPAGQVLPTDFVDKEMEHELRIAFDFDGVLADDSAEKLFQQGSLQLFHKSETDHASEPLPAGPLHQFLKEIARLQEKEKQRAATDPLYKPRMRTAIVTARNAPAHKRVITSLRVWGIHIDEAFFLGGIEKSRVLSEFRPHIFFDDQLLHVRDAASMVPSVHVPFGIANKASGVAEKPEVKRKAGKGRGKSRSSR
jgi:5'-nucleotidase